MSVRKVLNRSHWWLTGQIYRPVVEVYEDRGDAVVYPLVTCLLALATGYVAFDLAVQGDYWWSLAVGVIAAYVAFLAVVSLVASLVYFRHYGLIKPAEERVDEVTP